MSVSEKKCQERRNLGIYIPFRMEHAPEPGFSIVLPEATIAHNHDVT